MSRDNPKTLSDLAAAPAAVKAKEKVVSAGAPTYEAEARLFVNGSIIESGATFQSDEKPGQFWRHVSGPEWKPQLPATDKPKAV
jgi:hypothetical protein